MVLSTMIQVMVKRVANLAAVTSKDRSILSDYRLAIHALLVPLARGGSLSVPTLMAIKGGVVALLGPNGSGRTSLLRAIAGLHQYSGEIYFDGSLLNGVTAWQRARHGIVYIPTQGLGLIWSMTVEENLSLAMMHRCDRAEADDGMRLAKQYFPIVKEKPTHEVAKLSGGERQQVALARALVAAPLLLLLDEPLAGLAKGAVDIVLEVLEALRSRGCTLIACDGEESRINELCNAKIGKFRDGAVNLDIPM